MNLIKLKKYRFSLLCCFLGFACLAAFNFIGSHVDQGGVLVEPFGLIPLFWGFQLLAVISFIVTLLRKQRTLK